MKRYAIVLLILSVAMTSACAGKQTVSSETVLVGGATGRQGQAVIAELQLRGYRVRGLTRNPDSKAARALLASGVELVQGDYGDPGSLDRAMAGASKVFFYSGFSANEYAEGTNVLTAAAEAGVSHLVYSSGAAAEPGTGVPGPKTEIERAIVASGMPYTVLRPVAFMENFTGQRQRILRTGISDSRAPDRMLHFIAIDDIGFFVAEAFREPQTWLNQTVNIAGDQLSVQDHVDVFSRVLAKDIAYNRMPLDDYLERFPAPLRPLFRWYDEVGYTTVDVQSLRARYPQLLTLEDWLVENEWGVPD